MTYEEFLHSQNDIYTEIEQAGNSLVASGVQAKIASAKIPLIYYRYGDSFVDKLAKISQTVGDIVPALTYSANTIHTTISTLPTGVDSNKISAELGNIDLEKFNPQVRFTGVIYNQDSVIAKGLPNRDFFELAVAITELMNGLGIQVRLPKMAHITLARFKKNVTDKTILGKLQSYLSEVELNDEVLPISVSVGEFTMTDNSLSLKTIQSFDLIN